MCRAHLSSRKKLGFTRERDEKRKKRMGDIALQEIYNSTMELSVRDLAGLLLDPYRPRVTLRRVHPWSRPIFPLLSPLHSSPSFLKHELSRRNLLLFSRCARDVARIGRRFNPLVKPWNLRSGWERNDLSIRWKDRTRYFIVSWRSTKFPPRLTSIPLPLSSTFPLSIPVGALART